MATDTPFVQVHEENITGRLIEAIPYFSEPTGSAFARCRGVASVPTLLEYANEFAPAALVQFRGEVEQPRRAPIGLPLQTEVTLVWWVHLLALTFGASGEGRLGGQLPEQPGAYQMVDDTFFALAGFQVNPEHDWRLEYAGSEFVTVVNQRIVYVSKWRHRARRTGLITFP